VESSVVAGLVVPLAPDVAAPPELVPVGVPVALPAPSPWGPGPSSDEQAFTSPAPEKTIPNTPSVLAQDARREILSIEPCITAKFP
jgi:hypothetical protein